MSRFQLLSDAQWDLISGFLPGPTGRKGRPFSDARTMVKAIEYRYRTGIAWRDLPVVFGPWQTVWKWHRRMAGDGTWDRVHAALLARADATGKLDWSVSVDSPIARAHRHATNITRVTGGASSNYNNSLIEPPDHGFGRSRDGLSTKLHHLVDGHRLPLVIAVTPGQAGDSPMRIPLLEQLRIARPIGRPRTRPDRLRGDKALRHPQTMARPATRYDKLAIVYRSAAVLNAVLAWTRHLGDTP
ncbi:IS5 family transposase [Microbacterium sp. 20-116]|uniref:IS5 family transposase n=1 Tax=Microbacterium sp. 20-116 TaxID=3239883 RepID=UPI0034E270F7